MEDGILPGSIFLSPPLPGALPPTPLLESPHWSVPANLRRGWKHCSAQRAGWCWCHIWPFPRGRMERQQQPKAVAVLPRGLRGGCWGRGRRLGLRSRLPAGTWGHLSQGLGQSVGSSQLGLLTAGLPWVLPGKLVSEKEHRVTLPRSLSRTPSGSTAPQEANSPE